MRQEAKFAQAHWVLSIVSIECYAVGLALVKEGRNCHLSGCSEKVCELRVGLCLIIAGVNGADGMEELSSRLSEIRQRHANFNPVAIPIGKVDSSSYNQFGQTRHCLSPEKVDSKQESKWENDKSQTSRFQDVESQESQRQSTGTFCCSISRGV